MFSLYTITSLKLSQYSVSGRAWITFRTSLFSKNFRPTTFRSRATTLMIRRCEEILQLESMEYCIHLKLKVRTRPCTRHFERSKGATLLRAPAWTVRQVITPVSSQTLNSLRELNKGLSFASFWGACAKKATSYFPIQGASLSMNRVRVYPYPGALARPGKKGEFSKLDLKLVLQVLSNGILLKVTH